MIKAVVFDWAGTMVDFGSRAPMQAFASLFEENGLKLTIEDARVPMGLKKWDHIEALFQMPHIQLQFQKTNKRPSNDEDIDSFLEQFIPMNAAALRTTSTLIPGAIEAVRFLRENNIRIGSNTGYTRDLMDILMPLAAKQGYVPDCCYCAGDTPEGRPSPQMLEKIAEQFSLSSPKHMIKVDDTLPGLLEGKNFGCLTVGVALSGNALGLSLEEFNALPPSILEAKKQEARERVKAMKPDFIIDSVADLPQLMMLKALSQLTMNHTFK
jgi:phosphonoacetaldehyde hydrolase